MAVSGQEDRDQMHSEVCMIKHNMTFKEQIEEEKNMIEMLTERPGRLKKTKNR